MLDKPSEYGREITEEDRFVHFLEGKMYLDAQIVQMGDIAKELKRNENDINKTAVECKAAKGYVDTVLNLWNEFKDGEYEEMIRKIAAHRDFRKRNPVDIGIDCGYAEEDVVAMIKRIEEGSANNRSSGLQNKYYFFIRKDKGAFLASVDTSSWKTKVVKQIEGYDEGDRYDIKQNIFVRTTGNACKILLWENIDTGKTKKWLSDESIERILILNFGILIALPDEWVIWDGKTIVARKKFPRYFGRETFWINAGSDIYVYDRFGYMCVIDEKLEGEFREYNIQYPSVSGMVTLDPEIHELGEDGGRLFGYGYYQKYGEGLFNTNKVYREFPINFEMDGTTRFSFFRNMKEYPEGVIRDFTTKDYILLGIEIYSRKQVETNSMRVEPVCCFRRNIYRKQVIADYEKNIFIGLDDNDDIIKIDLENERQAVVIPVEMI